MPRLTATASLIALLLSLGAAAKGQEDSATTSPPPAAQAWTLSFYFENDLFFTGRDEDYTNGWKLSWISPDVGEYRDAGRLPARAYRLFEALPIINQPARRRNVVIGIGQNMYTPIDIERSELIEDDRPYAAWLYGSVGLHNKTQHRLDTLEISIGVVGPLALGEHIQNFVHRQQNIPEAQGWNNQIRNEPGINLIGERKLRYDLLRIGERWGADGILHFGGSLGNVFTYANSGITLRAGFNLPEDFGASLIRFAGDTNAPAISDDLRFTEGSAWSLHGFAGFDARAMLRDVTLDGNTFTDSHSIPKRTLVADMYLGLAVVRGRWKLSYAQTTRTRTHEGGRQQIFGSINISRTF